MTDVPPGQQCTLCQREAVDPERTGTLCRDHLDELDDGTEEGQSDDANPGCEPDKPQHNNPIDAGAVTDDDRADMLREYLEAFHDEFGRVPRLMPLDEEGKAPIIQGRCPLDSPEGRSYLVDGPEAVEQIREDGARGFALYAGKQDHQTHDLVLVDVDERDTFPYDSFPDSLKVMSGSGRGDHFTYRTGGDVQNAKGKGDVDGEIRAENWYCVVPGSIHPSGGVYHVVENRDIAQLDADDIPPELQPGTKRSNDTDAADLDKFGEGETPDDDTVEARLEAAFNNPHDGERIKQVFNGKFRLAGFDDRSSAEFWLANRLDSWVGCGNRAVLKGLMNRANLQKWPERKDSSYRDSVLANVGYQDWYYDPESDANPYVDPTAVLPETDNLLDPATGWNWRHAGARAAQEKDPVQAARDRTTDAIVDAIESGDQVLIEALMTTGKSYGAVKAAAETSQPVTILTERHDLYEQLRKWCDERGLSHYTLPSFMRDCDTANGEEGQVAQDEIRSVYHDGATPQDIHKDGEYERGRPWPCQQHEGQSCPYPSLWKFDADDVDVLIGHPVHAYNEKVTSGRTVIFDEFNDEAFETYFGPNLEATVSAFLDGAPGLPFDDYADLMEGRQDKQTRAKALAWFDEHGIEPNPTAAFQDGPQHALAPLATFVILAGAKEDCDLGNGWERVSFPDSSRVGTFNRETNEVHILSPPDLQYASGVIALDGTPTKDMWELALGTRLNHRQVLTDTERHDYITDGLGLDIIPTTDAIKPYNSAQNVNVSKDGALLKEIVAQHDRKLDGVITTSTALDQYQDEELLEFDEDSREVSDGPADRVNWYGNIHGSNEFKEARLGAVIGSNHYGDRYVEKWGAYAGEVVERNGGKGADLSYGEFGDRVLEHMREHNTAQAVMRFGRDGNGAVVYTHTDTLPEWMPVAGEGRVIKPWSQGVQEVLDVIEDLGEWQTAEVADHPAVSIGQRQVFNVLKELSQRGYLDREFEGRGFTWRKDGLHEVNEYGDVELETVDIEEVDDDTVDEICRNSTHTWSFRNSSAAEASHPRSGGERADDTSGDGEDAVDPPPKPGD